MDAPQDLDRLRGLDREQPHDLADEERIALGPAVQRPSRLEGVDPGRAQRQVFGNLDSLRPLSSRRRVTGSLVTSSTISASGC